MNNTTSGNSPQHSLSSFNIFAALEKESKESITIKKLYVRICDDDLVAGLILSHIVYWFGNNQDGSPRAKHKFNGRTCIVRQRNDWWDECCVSPKQYDRAITLLKEKGFVDVETHKSSFHRWETAQFIFVNEQALMKAVFKDIEENETELIPPITSDKQGGIPELPKREFQNLPNGNTGLTEKGTPYIQPLHTTTTYNKNTYAPPIGDASASPPVSSSSKKEKPKVERRHNVHTTNEEHKKLVDKYGADFTEACYDDLSEWKESAKPSQVSRHTCDYRRITKWVAIELKERQVREEKLNQPNIAAHRRNSKLLIPADSKPSTYKREEL